MMPLLTRFKWGVVLFLSGLAIGPLFSQSTVVSVTVVDQGAQVWKNGTISYVFQGNGSFGGKYQWNGANLPNQYLTPTIVALDASGAATFTIPTSTAISPAGSTWKYVVCPNASAINCPVINIPTIGTTQNISSTVTANAPAISMNPTPMPLAYTDAEVQTVPNQGGIYFNTTSLLPRYWDGALWHNFGSGGGGTPATPLLSFQANVGGAFAATPCLLGDITAVNVICTFGTVINNGGDFYNGYTVSCNPAGIPGFNYTHNLSAQTCLNIQTRDTAPGYSLGNPGLPAGAGGGWYNSFPLNQSSYLQSAGIKSGYSQQINCAGTGDCNITGFNPHYRGGTSAYSDEGTIYQLKMSEDVQTSGNVRTGGGGTGVNTLGVNKNNNTDGVGQLIIDTTDDVIATTITAVSNPTVRYAVATVAATLPVSVACSTVVSNVAVPTQAEGTYTSFTFTLNTTVDLTSAAASHLLFTVGYPYIETNKLVSAGTFTGTTQPVTVLLNKSIIAGAQYCIGGMSGRALEQVPYTINGQIYALRVIGSPTNHTMWVSYMTSQGPMGQLTGSTRTALPMNVNLYHSATIVGGVDPASTTFTITDNDAAWTNASNWISPNYVTNTIGYNVSETFIGPYTIDLGFSKAVNGVSLFGSDSFSSNNTNTDGNYISFGGLYTAPIAMHLFGQHGAGFLFENAPDTLLWLGNFWRGAAISMGVIKPGSSVTEWTVADYRATDDRFSYTPSSGVWNIVGSGGLTINASQACTAANITTTCGVTGTGTVTHTGSLTLNKFMLGNGLADSKVDPNAGTDGAGNVTGLSYTAVGTTPGFSSWGAGTGTMAALVANSAGFVGPITGGTSYVIKLPSSIAAGIPHFGAPGSVNGVNTSLLTSSLIAIADFSATGTPSSTTFLRGDNVWAVPAGGGSSPLTTKGDIYGFDTAGNRIPVGANGQILTADSTNALGVSWQNATSGFTNPMTTLGDQITGAAAGVAQRVGIGSTGQVWTVVGGIPAWATASGGSALSALTAATGGNTIANGDNAQIWNWAETTTSRIGMTFGETTAATGATSRLVSITTLIGSTALPLVVSNSLNGSQVSPALTVSPTWNTSSVPTAFQVNVTNTASGAGARLATFQVSGSNLALIDIKGFIKGTAFGSTGTKFTTTGCSVSATAGGASAGTFTVGANTCTVVVTINGATGLTATTGYSCYANDQSSSTVFAIQQTASSTTTASFSIPATAGATDVINFGCLAY